MVKEKSRAEMLALSLPSRKALPPFEALRAFDAVARLGGVRKAAQGLDRDHAVVSRHLRAIEAWTGTVLIERTSTGIALTEEGQKYHQEISKAIEAIANATIGLMKRSDNHRLYIWCVPGFAFHWLTGHLGSFESTNPGLDIDLRPTDTSPDLLSHEADVDIRIIPEYGDKFELQAGLRSIEFASTPLIGVASPDYLASHPKITKPYDLLDHHLLHEEDFTNWREWLLAHDIDEEERLAGPRLWQGHLTLDAARHGRGIALTNHLVASADLKTGRLVDVAAGLESFGGYKLGNYIFIARIDRWDVPSVKRYREWLLATVAKDL
ncbi:LysR substrate-binding domain-containing protein [Kordiimonas pumila]|uniref:LysR substrate-binding domain-containing protein n=1 Tax=Kordiimonas pumila TaxID=2161677 RepID=A0ABV7DAB0_9PROT|nr:LysR substrate-binding domain-containing protein [Kordiimonas pumila]